MAAENNKRTSEDRRLQDIGPPKGWSERRKRVERRLPEVEGLPFSAWITQFRGYMAKETDQAKV